MAIDVAISGGVILTHSSIGYDGGTVIQRYSNVGMQPNVWYQYCTVYFRTGKYIDQYINGVLTPHNFYTTNGTGNPWADSGNKEIGRHPIYGGVNYWNGSIDELSVWNRTLSKAEIQNIYNLQKGTYLSENTSRIIGADVIQIGSKSGEACSFTNSTKGYNLRCPTAIASPSFLTLTYQEKSTTDDYYSKVLPSNQTLDIQGKLNVATGAYSDCKKVINNGESAQDIHCLITKQAEIIARMKEENINLQQQITDSNKKLNECLTISIDIKGLRECMNK